ncbi:ATP/GTP-binding protein [Nakamurella sp. YIM 132087]|uniref:ATP/GTP-binding protein n=1 Tax=Nakamurella alba TaxID=2665158 RepID=A0A7K1FLG2_9ACTN|nr:HpcH/HpaI aldolase/citrate lyase family protein [Nakamurella alba]MTD14982.1 ATP/GTP-binding protein [Nakamurella alba]
MRHFDHLSDAVRSDLFLHQPQDFHSESPRSVLAHALGATLYMPGSRSDLATTLRKRAAEGVRSMVLDLEDAVADRDVADAMLKVQETLDKLSSDPLPAQLFVRVRTPDQIRTIVDGLPEKSCHLQGFVLPKFSAATGARFLAEIANASEQSGLRLLAMPVLETQDVLYRETRDEALTAIRGLLHQYREFVLAVRLGATDLCGLYGIRRDRDLTIYDVGVVADLIAEVVNHLGRADGTGYAITGPVWEYFAGHERMLRPQLRQTPFAERQASSFRHHLVQSDVDGLLREVLLDRANGLIGKTVIHPSHVAIVHALSVVPQEEYQDALDILASDADGVRASGARNKMNEMRPHRRWAGRIVDRAAAFGVLHPDSSHVDVLSALLQGDDA